MVRQIWAYPNLWQGVVGAWCMSQGNTGPLLLDRSGYSNHGTLNGFALSGATGNWAASNGQLALDFDGTNDYVSVPNSSTLNLTNAITFSLWYNSRSLPPGVNSFNYCLLSKQQAGSPFPSFDVRGGSSSTLQFSIVIANIEVQVSLGTINQNEWTFIAATYNGASVVGYRNGVQVASASASGSIGTTTNPLWFGNNPANTTRWYNGLFDDIRIASRAFNPAEITLLAQRRGIAYTTIPNNSLRGVTTSVPTVPAVPTGTR